MPAPSSVVKEAKEPDAIVIAQNLITVVNAIVNDKKSDVNLARVEMRAAVRESVSLIHKKNLAGTLIDLKMQEIAKKLFAVENDVPILTKTELLNAHRMFVTELLPKKALPIDVKDLKPADQKYAGMAATL